MTKLSSGSCCQCHSNGLNIHHGLKFVSSLILPLTLGIFTVVITLHQQNISIKQRLEDRQLAKEQREQDLNVSRMQRLEDRLMAREQREQDLNISVLQRDNDKQIAKQQRDQDKEIAENKNRQDEWLAEKQRNMSEQQRAHEISISQEQLRDALLVAYMNEIGQLLKDTNGSLTADPITAIVARAKTLTVIRQLDPTRNSHLIRFLYEAKQLTAGADPLDLSDAELNYINLSSTDYQSKMHRLSLAGAYLRNASFLNRDLFNANFSSCRLENATFKQTNLAGTDFSRATLVHIDFSSISMQGARFIQVRARDIDFYGVRASGAIFTNSSFKQVIFSNCKCDKTDFSYADFEISKFILTKLPNAYFMGAKMKRTNMTNANIESANFISSDLSHSDLSSINCEKAVLVRTDLRGSQLRWARAKDADFSGADLRNVTFVDANLVLATFSFANITNANFTNANLHLSNLSFTTMTKAIISDKQLREAGSIRHAILPNATMIVRDPNLLHNGHASCNDSVSVYWNVIPINGVITSQDEPDNCVFKGANATMSQHVNMNRFQPLSQSKRLIAVVMARCGGERISLHATDLSKRPISSVHFIQKLANITLRLAAYTSKLLVTIEFGENGWCDDLYMVAESSAREATSHHTPS